MSAVLTARMPHSRCSDDQLALRIERQLAADTRALSRLQIEVNDGVVTLRGTATSFYQKQLWLHGTNRVVGDLASIKDEIAVTSTWEGTDFGWRD